MNAFRQYRGCGLRIINQCRGQNAKYRIPRGQDARYRIPRTMGSASTLGSTKVCSAERPVLVLGINERREQLFGATAVTPTSPRTTSFIDWIPFVSYSNCHAHVMS